MARDRAIDWLNQAKNDLLWANDTLNASRFAQACFAAQQVAEKAITSLALELGYDEVRSHSILEITRAIEVGGEIEEIARRLDQYYITTRYPDAFATGAPFEYFTKAQAEEAVAFATRMIDLVTERFGTPADE